MRDLISIPRVAALHPVCATRCKVNIEAAESKLGPYVAVRVVQASRSIDVQNGLFEIGRTVKGSNARPGYPMGDTVTNARGGSSFHNFDLAIDFALLYDKDHNGTFESLSWDLVADFNRDGEADWMEVVKIFQADGWGWGGNWVHLKDNPHLEWRAGYPEDCKLLYHKWLNKDFIPGTQYVNI